MIRVTQQAAGTVARRLHALSVLTRFPFSWSLSSLTPEISIAITNWMARVLIKYEAAFESNYYSNALDVITLFSDEEIISQKTPR